MDPPLDTVSTGFLSCHILRYIGLNKCNAKIVEAGVSENEQEVPENEYEVQLTVEARVPENEQEVQLTVEAGVPENEQEEICSCSPTM